MGLFFFRHYWPPLQPFLGASQPSPLRSRAPQRRSADLMSDPLSSESPSWALMVDKQIASHQLFCAFSTLYRVREFAKERRVNCQSGNYAAP